MKSTTLLAHGLLLLSALGSPDRAEAQQLPHAPQPAPYQPYRRTDPNSPIGGDLQRLYGRWAGTAGHEPTPAAKLPAVFPQLQLTDGGRTVLVHLTARDVHALREALAARGFVVKSSHPERHFMDGYLPLAQLVPGAAGLAGLTGQGLLGILPAYRGRTSGELAAEAARRMARANSTASGPVIGQGAYLLQAERVRALGGYDGRGQRIGVLSDSFDKLHTAAASIAAGDLPAEGVRVLQEYPGLTVDEGQSMCELIYDLAPGAQQVFSSGFFSPGDMADQIRRLADPAEGHCTIIVDNITYSEEPVYQRGVIAQAAADARAQGIPYFAAAANIADKSYLNNAPAFVAQAGGAARLNFNTTGTGVVALWQHVTVPHGQVYGTRLWWSDPYYTTAGVQTDLDMYLLSSRGDTIVTGTEANQQNQVPNEVVVLANDTSQTHTTDFYLHLVRRAGTANPARLRLTYYGVPPDEWLTTGYTTTAHAGDPAVITVAAVPFYDINQPEPFTSKGGGLYLFSPTGTPLATPQVLVKPDLTALDGTDTRFFGPLDLPRTDRPVNGYPNFYGTSAAAPHAAAVAALLWQARPTLTVAQLQARLQSTARDIGPAGFDDLTGFGVVDAYAAIYGTAVRPAVPTAAQPWVDDMNRGGLSHAWVVSATGPARPRVRSEIGPASGRYHLVLDASAQSPGSPLSVALGPNTAAATLHANLGGAAPSTGWYLTFRHKRVAGETDQQLPAQFSGAAYGDGVSLSADGGQTWYRLVDLTTLPNTTYQVQSTNLSAFAQANSLTLGSDVRVRFQQSGLTSADSTGGPARGGWAFDDVALTAGPAGVLPLFTSTAASATCPSLTVTFTDASLNASAGAARLWSFPGGSPATSTAANPVVTYAAAGTYNVSLTVGAGSSAVTLTDTAYVRLPGRAPVPVATASKTRVCPAEAVQFTASAVYCPGGYSWRFPGGTPARSTAANPTVTYATPGIYPVVLTATNATGSDSIKTLRIQVKPTKNVPTVVEPFNTAPVPDYWEIVNPDNDITWISFPAIGPNGQDGSSVGVNCYDYAAVGQRDQLLSAPVALPASLPRATLRFAVAYAQYPGSTDSLLVRVLSRCAPHQVLGTVYRKGGAQLATAPPTLDSFFPASAQQWRTEQVNLSAYRGQDVLLAFECYNGNSNILWLDDYRVDAQAITATTSAQATAAGLLAWPNPVAGHHALMVEAPAAPAPATLRLLDALGREVWHGTAPASATPTRQPVSAPTAAGVYLLRYVPTMGQPLTQRVVVE